ncbi:hypothetical protein ACL02S_15905 [Nocardia sp. 004]|uniref:hypothetical protein n=1 Tax=Nocardia sp. 004 TaxID=3385978 RepID=UPI0039A013CA
MAHHFGFELVGVERLTVHGGEMRYTIAHPETRADRGCRRSAGGGADERPCRAIGARPFHEIRAAGTRDDVISLLRGLTVDDERVVGYGAAAKSATVLNYCGIRTRLS